MKLFSVTNCTGFTDDCDLYLTWIGHLILNLLGDLRREALRLLVVDLVCTHDHTQLTTRLSWFVTALWHFRDVLDGAAREDFFHRFARLERMPLVPAERLFYKLKQRRHR